VIVGIAMIVPLEAQDKASFFGVDCVLRARGAKLEALGCSKVASPGAGNLRCTISVIVIVL